MPLAVFLDNAFVSLIPQLPLHPLVVNRAQIKCGFDSMMDELITLYLSCSSEMATDDSMSDDVFESEDALSPGIGLNVIAETYKTPSPTGYRDYKPPPELFEAPSPCLDQVNHKVPSDCPNAYRNLKAGSKFITQ